jgi:hypothetical protein
VDLHSLLDHVKWIHQSIVCSRGTGTSSSYLHVILFRVKEMGAMYVSCCCCLTLFESTRFSFIHCLFVCLLFALLFTLCDPLYRTSSRPDPNSRTPTPVLIPPPPQ